MDDRMSDRARYEALGMVRQMQIACDRLPDPPKPEEELRRQSAVGADEEPTVRRLRASAAR